MERPPRKKPGHNLAARLTYACFIIALVVSMMRFGTTLVQDPTLKVWRTGIRMESIARASRAFYQEFGKWPESLAAITHTGNARMQAWEVDSRKTNDAWGWAFHYEAFSSATGYGQVYTVGKDGQPGGKGVNADFGVRFSYQKNR
jgi:hypothetical protein